jgi:hypothetical protein
VVINVCSFWVRVIITDLNFLPQDVLQGLKSAPVGGLVWKLSIIMAYLFALHSNYTVIAHLWVST